MAKIISTILSPNAQNDDVFLAFKMLFKPSLWQDGTDGQTSPKQALEAIFCSNLGVKQAYSFNAGRSALLAILEALKAPDESEVLVQAFTCNAVLNPILKAKLKPVFVDIDDKLNIDPKDLDKKITNKTKAIIVQHTFGHVCQIEEIKRIAKENNIILIEDCAHALGTKYEGQYLGTFGDAAFYSFGRDKMISCVYGGMAVASNQEIQKNLEENYQKLEYPNSFWTFQQLLHPVLMNWVVLPTYSFFKLGLAFLKIFQGLRLLSFSVYPKENNGLWMDIFPKKMPQALAVLANNQIKKLDNFNKHREEIAQIYISNIHNPEFKFVFEPGTYLRFPVICNDPDLILNKLRKSGIYLEDGWRRSVIVPSKSNLKSFGYEYNCPRAQEIAGKIFNLPTHINISFADANKISLLLNKQ